MGGSRDRAEVGFLPPMGGAEPGRHAEGRVEFVENDERRTLDAAMHWTNLCAALSLADGYEAEVSKGGPMINLSKNSV